MSVANAAGITDVVTGKTSLSDYFSTQFQNLTPVTVLIGLLAAFVTGLIIAFVYKRCYRGVLYSPSFSVTLMLMTLITTPVVMCIKSDIALSMGMVGALSIVRFRTAVKEPLDTAYMFWALTMGILIGAELYVHALVAVLGISVFIFLITFFKLRHTNAYLLVVHYEDYAEQDITQLLRRTVQQRKLRSKTVTRAGAEMTVEVRMDNKQDLVAAVLNLEGVHDATLVSCQTEAGT